MSVQFSLSDYDWGAEADNVPPPPSSPSRPAGESLTGGVHWAASFRALPLVLFASPVELWSQVMFAVDRLEREIACVF